MTDVRRFMAFALTLALVVGASGAVSGQGRSAARKAPPPPPAPLMKVAPEMMCPTPLGVGVTTKLSFCDIMTGRDPAAGMLIALPPHSGPVTLTFDLHNRHTYSEEQMKTNRAFARYTATVGVLTLDNTLISRRSCRTISEGDRPSIAWWRGRPRRRRRRADRHRIPHDHHSESEDQFSILGEKLTYERIDGSATYTSPGRPIAVISNVMIEYRPAPPPKPVPPKPAPRPRK